MKQFLIIALVIFASITTVAQNGNNTITVNNSDTQTTPQNQTTTQQVEKEQKVTSTEEKEVSIFDNNILHPEVIAKSDKNKEDK